MKNTAKGTLRTRRLSALGKGLAVLLFSSSALGAQQGPPATEQPQQSSQQQPWPGAEQRAASSSTSSQSKAEEKGKSEQKENAEQKAQANPETGTSKDRLFYTLPNFLTVENNQLPPMTPGQKFKAVTRGSFDYVEYAWYGALAGISQAENSEPGYGQGAAGYGKRYAAAFADGTIENFMTGAVLPSLLKQDPRFYQTGRGTFWHRTKYAISRIFITYSDSGHNQFNFSEIIGSAMSAGISTYSYHPRSDRNFGNAASVWGSQVGYDTLTIVVKEFWPDIRRKIGHKQQVDPPTP